MDKKRSEFKAPVWLMVSLFAGFIAGCGSGDGGIFGGPGGKGGAGGPLAINLGAAATYGIVSQQGLTSTGVTVVNGDVALDPLATCTDSTTRSRERRPP